MAKNLTMNQIFINKLTEILDVNLENENFGVVELANEVGLSRSQLHRKLQSITQQTPSQFIREYRLQKAMALLKDHVATASEIAYRVGFGSPTYFNTCFKDFFGYPPGEVKFYYPNSGTQLGQARDPQVLNTQHLTSLKKNKIVMYSISGLVVLFAITYILYTGTQKEIPITTENTVTTSSREKSIAVLPFANLSGNLELEYISDGMTDAIISRLSKINSIKKVVPFTTMSSYKESNKRIIEIATELGVTHLLEGNVQMSADTVRIAIRLIDGRADTYDWSDEFKAVWNNEEVFRMQASVAEQVARNMNVQVTEIEVGAVQRIPTKNKEAYNLYLQAEYQMQKYTKTAFKKSIQLYEKAIALDTNYIEPYIGMAHLWDTMGWMGFYEPRAAIANSRKFAEKVLELDPANESIENEMYAGLWWFEWDFDKVEPYFQNRLANGSLYQSKQMILYALSTDRIEPGYIAIEKALLDEPNEAKLYAFKALALFQLEKKEEALEFVDKAGPLYGDNWFYYMYGAKLYYLIGSYDKSRNLLAELAKEELENQDTEVLLFNAIYYSMDHLKLKENKYLNRLLLKYSQGAHGSPAWYLANYYCVNGEYEKTFDWLQKSYDQHEVALTWLFAEPFLEPIKNDARYKELCYKVGITKVVNF